MGNREQESPEVPTPLFKDESKRGREVCLRGHTMGNLAITPPELESGERYSERIPERGAHSRLLLVSRPVLIAQPVPDQSILGSLVGNLRDTFFPKKLPPLVLTSQAVAVSDPMAVERGKGSSVAATFIHAAVIAAIVWFTIAARNHVVVQPQVHVTPVLIRPYIPITAPTPKPMGGGGGGGEHHVVEPTKGHLPRIVKTTPIVKPQLLVVDHPKLAVQPAIKMPQQIKLPPSKMPNMGMPQSTQVAMASQGPGAGSGFGSTSGGGIGMGSGNGLGVGSGGGYGGGVMSVGGGVSAPRLIHSVDPEFTNQARAANLQGSVAIQLIVDARGNPQNIHVIKHLGMGLDEKAIEAVRQYRFSPALFQGHPVAVQMVINVNFHLY